MADSPHAEWIREHIELYASDPDKGHLWDASHLGGPGPLPTLLLTTTGRKTAKDRVVPLVYGRAGESYVVVASRGGTPTHPIWFLNLETNPECRLQIARNHVTALARVATGEEREGLWKAMVDLYPSYAEYQKAAVDRVIPIVVLDPKD